MSNTNNPDYNTTPNPDEVNDGARQFAEFMARPHEANDHVEKVWEDLAELGKIADKVGVYIIKPTEVLIDAARRYFTDTVENIGQILLNGGADTETVQAVFTDYMRALFGMYPLKANEEQMVNALKAVDPVQAFTADRYVLYYGVFSPYAATTRFFTDYVKNVKLQPDPKQRQEWFETVREKMRAADAVAFSWMQDCGYIVVSDFSGVEQDAIRRFLNTMENKAAVGRYLRYYAVAKFALRATGEQLAAIDSPRQFSAPNMAIQYAEEIMVELQRDFDQKAALFANVLKQAATDETPATQVVKEAKAAKAAIETIRIPENYALINSRGMWAAADGKNANDILPISVFIEDYVKRHAEGVGVTPLMLHKAVEGVNILQQIKRERPSNGIYTLRTNISEFCELCDFKDANEDEKQKMMAALRVLHNLYLIVWKPTGRVAVQLFGIQQIGLSGKERGNLVLNVFASGLQGKGKPNLVSSAELSEMKRKEKGISMTHFRYQILSKGHKVESMLLDEIFGYSDRIKEAERTGDTQQVAAVREYVRKNKSRDKKRLRQWFDDWAARGIISYEIKTAKNGETVYSWRRLMAPTDEEKEQLKPKTTGQ